MTTVAPKAEFDLDHVAIASLDIEATLQTAVGELGGVVFHGGDGYGFRWLQTRLGTPGMTGTTGMTIELLEVWQPEVNDFLARFLERHGPGVHHITFKVRDIEAALARCAAAGVEPVGVNLENPAWREAFLQPKQAHGTVVQLAQTSDEWQISDAINAAEHRGEPLGTPMWWPVPPARGANPVTLQRVVLGSPDRTAATAFFAGLLGAAATTTTDDNDADNDDATDLAWPGGGCVRLVDADRAGFLRLEGTRGAGGTGESVDRADTTVDLSGAPVLICSR